MLFKTLYQYFMFLVFFTLGPAFILVIKIKYNREPECRNWLSASFNINFNGTGRD